MTETTTKTEQLYTVWLTVKGEKGPWDLPCYATSADDAAKRVAKQYRKPVTIHSVALAEEQPQ